MTSDTATKKTMREIKFRAMGVGSNNGWFYGYFWETEIQAFISNYTIKELAFGDFAIDKKTVGQFTGLLDKNGKEIYEGDILKHDLWGITHVIWEHGMFRAIGGEYDVTMADHQLQRIKVIGNIYENPELLGETK